jgi:DNA-binding CsgD family transcriptional regulator
LLALVQCGAGLVRMLSEDYEGAIASTRSGLTLAEDVEDPKIMRDCLAMSSMVLIQTGVAVQEGLRNVERAVELARRVHDPAGLTFALVNLQVALMLCERFDAMQSVYEEFLQVPVASEHPRLRTWAEQAAAWAQISVGSPARALQHAEVALDLEGDWPSMTYFQIIGFRIHALARMGRTGEALAEGDAAMRLANESGALQAVPAIELALTVAECMRGDFEAAAAHARSLLAMPQAHTLALAHETLARRAILRGESDRAREHAVELDALAERSGSERQHGLADHIRGCAAIHTGKTSEARDRLHAALARYEQLGCQRDAADVLDELALLDVRDGAVDRGARLAGAAAAIRAGLDCCAVPGAAERLQAARAQSLAAGAADGWEAAWAQGQELAPADAVAYARRRRGPRARPQTGWASLTPAEIDVASLAADGMTNPQIAARLFIARGTVKMHLSRAYRKLGVKNRTGLAAAAMANRIGAGELP